MLLDRSLQGHFLLALPDLEDPNFDHTVVFILEHDSDGASGLVLNRPTRRTIDDVWTSVMGESCGVSDPLYTGGPVDGPVIALHNDPLHSELEIVPGVFVASERDKVARIVEAGEAVFRLFSGYSGWGPQQLDQEIAVGAWLTRKADAVDVFGPVETLWKDLRDSIGGDIYPEALVPRSRRVDPSLN